MARGVEILARVEGRVQRENSSSVLADIHAALSLAGVKLNRIELFAVATGPGSFTGLRAGLATLKAFALTLNRPVVGIPTLHAVALAAGESARVVAALPAGRGEVFAQMLSVTAAGEIEELGLPSHLSPASVCERAKDIAGDLDWAGAGAHAHAGMLKEFAQANGIGWGEPGAQDIQINCQTLSCWRLARPVEAYAEHVAALALARYRAGQAISADELSALYVRLSDAELNERCRGLK